MDRKSRLSTQLHHHCRNLAIGLGWCLIGISTVNESFQRIFIIFAPKIWETEGARVEIGCLPFIRATNCSLLPEAYVLNFKNIMSMILIKMDG